MSINFSRNQFATLYENTNLQSKYYYKNLSFSLIDCKLHIKSVKTGAVVIKVEFETA